MLLYRMLAPAKDAGGADDTIKCNVCDKVRQSIFFRKKCTTCKTCVNDIRSLPQCKRCIQTDLHMCAFRDSIGYASRGRNLSTCVKRSEVTL
jgi:hypothetical protein